MIVYADTSALVKLFVAEDSSESTRMMLLNAQAIGTGLLTRAELGSALARGARRRIITDGEAAIARQRLAVVWPTLIHVSLNQILVSRAESAAWKYGLRGYDAVHLAAALTWQEQMGYVVTLATFDKELWEAGALAGLNCWPEQL